VVPALYRDKTVAVRVQQRPAERQTLMKVHVRDSATASALSMALPGILARLNEYAPQTGFLLTRIELKVQAL
jgi:hypothetical protein